MLVGERMSKPVIYISPDLPINEALNLMKRERIRRVRDAFFATMPAGVRDISLADELVADRRREALRELSGNE